MIVPPKLFNTAIETILVDLQRPLYWCDQHVATTHFSISVRERFIWSLTYVLSNLNYQFKSLTSLSSLPGLRSAGSIAFGLFVAPMITSWPRDSKPSRRVRSFATILFSCSFPLLPLFGHRASSSSMNSTHGPCCEAFLKQTMTSIWKHCDYDY